MKILIDKEDQHLLSINSWRIVKGYVQRHRPKGQKEIMLHRLIIACPKGMYVDHINGNKLDNRRSNLRIVTPSQSIMNTKRCSDSLSKYKGISWHKKNKRWFAKIVINGKNKHLGSFKSSKEAAIAYDNSARFLFGEYARLNFPKNGERSCLQ